MSWHKFTHGRPYEWKGRKGAVLAALEKAEADMKAGVARVLVYGGPMAPWTGEYHDNLRAVGVCVEAVATCEVFNYGEVYADVYNVLTNMQRIEELDTVKSNVLFHCKPETIAATTDARFGFKAYLKIREVGLYAFLQSIEEAPPDD
jgi:hypothetical protein